MKPNFGIGDKVVCILDQRFKGRIDNIYTDKEFNTHQYEVKWEGEVPHDSSGAMFFGWQLKKIEEEKECWIDITVNIEWKADYRIKGYCLMGYHNDVLICTVSKSIIDLFDRKNYQIEMSPQNRYFTIYKKDC